MILVVVVHFARIVLPELARDRPARPAGTDPGNATGIETGEATAGSDADNPDTRD
jgi:hypothetical protein